MQTLKILRTEKGVYQKEVASAIGVDRTTYVKYENGDSEPGFDMLNKLADYYNVSTDYLLGRTNERNNINKSNIIDEEPDKDIIEITPFIKKIQKADPAFLDSIYKTLKAYASQLEAKDISETKR